jgi:hypothetical protein
MEATSVPDYLIADALRRMLSIRIEEGYDNYSGRYCGPRIKVSLLLEGEVISSDYMEIPVDSSYPCR